MWDAGCRRIPQVGQLRKRLAAFLRQQRGTRTEREFARRIGLSKSTLSRLQSAEQNVTIDTLEHLCRVFRCEVKDLFPPPS